MPMIGLAMPKMARSASALGGRIPIPDMNPLRRSLGAAGGAYAPMLPHRRRSWQHSVVALLGLGHEHAVPVRSRRVSLVVVDARAVELVEGRKLRFQRGAAVQQLARLRPALAAE